MILLDCTLSLQDTSPFACWRAAGYGDTLKNMSHGDFCLWYLSFELSMLSILPIKNSELSKVLNESSHDLYQHQIYISAFLTDTLEKQIQEYSITNWFTLHRFYYFYILKTTFWNQQIDVRPWGNWTCATASSDQIRWRLSERPPKPPTVGNSYTRTLILDMIMKLSGTIGVTQKTMTFDIHVCLIWIWRHSPSHLISAWNQASKSIQNPDAVCQK